MQAAALGPTSVLSSFAHLDLRQRLALALACVGGPIAALAARWIPDTVLQVAYSALLAGICLAAALLTRRAAASAMRQVGWTLFAFALVQLVNNIAHASVATGILGQTPSGANPLASSVGGTVAVQLLDTAIAVVIIVVVARFAGLDAASFYVRPASRRWLIAALAAFLVVYAVVLTIPLRPNSPIQQLLPLGTTLTMERVLALTPALVVVALSNGLQEELLFRGLFLQRFTMLFGAVAANGFQAAVFAVAHVGVGYTPLLLGFLVAVVFPLGLLGGTLMRTSNSIVVPTIAHGGLDLMIYLGFLAAVA